MRIHPAVLLLVSCAAPLSSTQPPARGFSAQAITAAPPPLVLSNGQSAVCTVPQPPPCPVCAQPAPPLTWGLFEGDGRTWMRDSGVKWDVRYRYLTYQWANNWNNGPRDGAFARRHMDESAAMGFLPAFSYYNLWDQLPAGVGQWDKVKNPTAMREYFSDFRLLMIRAKEFDRPVLVLVEPDALGFLEGEAKSPGAAAAVASTGLSELAGLPNTVAGWSLAFLQLRKAVGADKVQLGLHVSGWASGTDLFHGGVAAPLMPGIDAAYSFLAPGGLQSNVTGATYDVLVGDPLDRDADFYRLDRGEDRWWDPSDAAPTIGVKSFTRYVEWLRLWNQKAGKRWVLWQVPIGNQSSPNNCTAGYKDNRVEWMLGAGSAPHRAQLSAAGVSTVLFGAGASCQTTQDTDGNQLRDKARVSIGMAAPPVVVPPPVVIVPPPAPTGTCSRRIMPLGDSITLGVNGGYRNELFTKLRAAGCAVDFVGSQSDQYTRVADHDHEGHPGFTISNISDEVAGWLSSSTPSQVVLMIGTNDVAWWTVESGDDMAIRTIALVDKILIQRTVASVIVASIPPMSSAIIEPLKRERAQLASEYNAALRARVAAKNNRAIRFVDVNAVLMVADLYDGIHPNESAHTKIAALLFEAMKP